MTGRRRCRGLALAVLLASAPLTGQGPPSLDAIGGLINEGRFEQAESELRALLATRDGAEIRDLLGVALGAGGRTEEAKREFERAIEMAPDYAPAYQHLGRLHLQLQRPGAALEALRSAARLGPLERDLALELAALEVASGEGGAAEAQLRSVVERFDSARALLDLARLEARRGDNDRAFQTLERARELAPDAEDVLSAYARVALAVDAPVVAIDTLEALARVHPEVADYAYLLGIAQFRIAENAAAADALQRALALEPQNGPAWIALGLAYNAQKRFPEARDALARGLQLRPGNVDALVARAEAEAGLGELEEAERHVQRALELAPDAPAALYVVGKIRMAQERYAEARDALLRSVERDPHWARTYYQLSLAYSRLGDRESSKQYLVKYREALAREQERLSELLTEAGLGVSGMRSVGG